MSSAIAYRSGRLQTHAKEWRISQWLGRILFVVLLLSMIDGLMPQAEMALFAGHVLIPAVVLKWLVIAIAVLGMLIKRKIGTSSQVIYAWAALMIYLSFEGLFFTLTTNYSTQYIVYSFEATLYFLLLLPFMYAFKDTVDERRVSSVIMWLFVPLVLLGIWQGATNHPVLPTTSVDRYFQVYSWDFYGRVRAFSLFSSASNFGHFLALVAAMNVAAIYQWKGRRKLVATMGLVLALIATYLTLTRATYVEVLLAVTTAILITRFKRRGFRLSLLWGIYASIGLLVAFAAPVIVAGIHSTDHNTLADASLIMRYEEWAKYGGIWLNHGISTMLFGTGLMQSSRFSIVRHITIDNAWLSLLFQFGLVGFIIVMAYLWGLWKILLGALQAHPRSIITTGVVSTCSAFPFTSIFGITTVGYFLLFMIWLVSRKE